MKNDIGTEHIARVLEGTPECKTLFISTLPISGWDAVVFGNALSTGHHLQCLTSMLLHPRPSQPHVKAVKMIIRYLQAPKDKGLILKSDKSLALDSYVDANFTRLYGVEDKTDPESMKSRTGYIITIGGCPLVWKSKLQQLIALSTTETETNAVCDMMRVLLPLHLLIHEMSTYLGMQRTYKV